jgi:hydrogenase expression/formation protein HypC
MQLVELLDGEHGTAELEGGRQQVNISLIDNPRIGDYLIVHAGFAIEKLDKEEADERIHLFEELAEAEP